MLPTAPSAAPEVEVVVIGGGPSGCAAASVLASAGRSVVLVPGGRAPNHSHAESLPPSSRKPLEAAGLWDAVAGAGFAMADGNTSAWGTGELSTTPFDGGHGIQAERRRLDGLLLAAAAERGAEVSTGAWVRDVQVTDDTALVRCESRRGSAWLRARWVLDASGRAGVLARRGLRERSDGPETVAVIGQWDGGEGMGMNTIVESFSDGWAWCIPVAGGRRYVALMLDPSLTPLRGRPLEDVYRTKLADTRHLSRMLREARLDAPPVARIATPYAASRYVDRPVVLLGDAGSFLDPLSSFGVKKALASGWLAAIAVATALEDEALRGPAFELFEERERTAEDRFGTVARDHYAAAAEHHRGEFWARRSRPSSANRMSERSRQGRSDDRGQAQVQPSERRRDGPPAADLRAALQEIRGAETLRWCASPGIRTVPRPLVRGSRIVLEDHLVGGRLASPIRFFGAVRLPELLGLLPDHEDVPGLFAAYARAEGPVPLPEFLGGLATLLSYGLVEVTEPATCT